MNDPASPEELAAWRARCAAAAKRRQKTEPHKDWDAIGDEYGEEFMREER